MTDDRARSSTADRTQLPAGSTLTVADQPDGLYRLLVESVRDYAIFTLDPHGTFYLECRGRAHQRLPRRRDHRPALFEVLFPEDLASEKPRRELESPRARHP